MQMRSKGNEWAPTSTMRSTLPLGWHHMKKTPLGFKLQYWNVRLDFMNRRSRRSASAANICVKHLTYTTNTDVRLHCPTPGRSGISMACVRWTNPILTPDAFTPGKMFRWNSWSNNMNIDALRARSAPTQATATVWTSVLSQVYLLCSANMCTVTVSFLFQRLGREVGSWCARGSLMIYHSRIQGLLIYVVFNIPN